MSKKYFELYEALQLKLQKVLIECDLLREENVRLKAHLGLDYWEIKSPSIAITPGQPTFLAPQCAAITNNSPPEQKITLFRSMFRGREDLYPVRWESKQGTSGYSPACANEWIRGVCGKPRTKCSDCEHRELLPITDQVIHDHLTGKHTIGVYPLLPDETCWFLAVDFEQKCWQEDSAAFLTTCGELKIPAALKRSRSGNGGHVWIFFENAIPAHLARKLGFTVLTRTMERRHQVGFESYDRFFPSQDTMPKGRFGNLIALPLQYAPRANGNSVFVDQDFQPYKDQWSFLSSHKKMRIEEVETIVREAVLNGTIIGVPKSLTETEDGEDPWTLPPSKTGAQKPVSGRLPSEVRIVQSNLIYIEKKKLPPAMINRLMRIAAFQNPEFYKAQAMRLPTFDKPLVICCAEDYPGYLAPVR